MDQWTLTAVDMCYENIIIAYSSLCELFLVSSAAFWEVAYTVL